MSDNYSIQDLFKAGLTREQFISKYGEIKASGAESKSSVFGENMSGSVGEMFDILNSDGNDTIDDNEIKQLMSYADDGDTNSTVSENDLKVLYQKISDKIKSGYSSADPAAMYNTAMSKSADAVSSTYIEDLGSQIEVLNELISSRQRNSSNIISMYQSQIDDMILKSNKLSTKFKKEYKEASDEAIRLQKEADKNNSLIRSVNQEMQRGKSEADLISQEISSLDPENDKDDIASRQNELNKLNSRQELFRDDYDSLLAKQGSFSSKIAKAKATVAKLTLNAQNEDAGLKTQIDIYKNKIEMEKVSAQSDIKGYQSQLKILQAAQAYAISQLPKPGSAAESMEDSSFHKNDNNITFDELSKEGLKYSSKKGQLLAQKVRKGVVGFTGHCSRYVSNALASSGLGNERAAAAHMMDSALAKNQNFKEIKITSKEQLRSLPAGCIVVYEAGAARYSSKYGHIEVTLGNGTAASDGITRNMRYSENMSVFVPVENA